MDQHIQESVVGVKETLATLAEQIAHLEEILGWPITDVEKAKNGMGTTNKEKLSELLAGQL